MNNAVFYDGSLICFTKDTRVYEKELKFTYYIKACKYLVQSYYFRRINNEKKENYFIYSTLSKPSYI